MRTQPRLSDSERDERRKRDRERLKQAAEQLLTSEGWQRWVRVRAQGGLARLSLNNQLLVALSCPEATFVAGFRAWLKLGYCVRKGEKAIRIIAPMPIEQRETETADADDDMRVLFKGVSVFDRSQVAPIDGMPEAPLEPPSKPLTGDSHAHLLEPTRAFAESLGFTVSFESIPGATGGWCEQKARRIVVDADQPANAQLRILIHETIHGLGVGYAEYGRARAEVIVDTVTFSPCQAQSPELAGSGRR
jgi:N-terminal domain of anti-restriction factor ArdC